MAGWNYHLMAQEYTRGRLCEAEQWPLAQQALAGNRQRDPFHHRVLRWLGHQLAVWGAQLQKRYSEPCLMRPDMEGAKR
jgi:hypothetical protein